MPSPRHDTINQLFRERPELAVEILRELKGVNVPDGGPVRLESNDFNDRASRDLRPDTVITIGSKDEPVHGIVVEVQQRKSDGKRRQLPRYAATQWLELNCPVTVLCVCPDPDAATWYAEPTHTTLAGYVFQAVVLGPRDVPVISDPKEAAEQPELAVMAVMVHGRDPAVVETFAAALEFVPPDYAPKYTEYAYSMAAPTVQRMLREIMTSTFWPVYSPFAREHFGRGEEKGLEKGREEGRAEGRAEERANAILAVLRTRGVDVPEEAQVRIRDCTDQRLLGTWLERAVSATSVGDVLDG
jgi:hypothetical protein